MLIEEFLSEFDTYKSEEKIRGIEKIIEEWSSNVSVEISSKLLCDRLLIIIVGMLEGCNALLNLASLKLIPYYVDKCKNTLSRNNVITLLLSLYRKLGDSKATIRDAAVAALEKISFLITKFDIIEDLVKECNTCRNHVQKESSLRFLFGYLQKSQTDQKSINAIHELAKNLKNSANLKVREAAAIVLAHISSVKARVATASNEKASCLASSHDQNTMESRETVLCKEMQNIQLSNRISNVTERKSSQSHNYHYAQNKSPKVVTRSAFSVENNPDALSTKGSITSQSTSSFNRNKLLKNNKLMTFDNLSQPKEIAITEDDLVALWNDQNLPKSVNWNQIYKDLQNIKGDLSYSSTDWSVRVNAMKLLRGIICIYPVTDQDRLVKELNKFTEAFSKSVKDLRSKLHKEIFATISYTSYKLGDKFSFIGETLFPTIAPLFTSSPAPTVSSAMSCVILTIKHSRYPRLIDHLLSYIQTNKSIPIRRKCAIFLLTVLKEWSADCMLRYGSQISVAISIGLKDPDNEVRATSALSFWEMVPKFAELAIRLYGSLEPRSQNLLNSKCTSAELFTTLGGRLSRSCSVTSNSAPSDLFFSSNSGELSARWHKLPSAGTTLGYDGLGQYQPLQQQQQQQQPLVSPSTSGDHKDVIEHPISIEDDASGVQDPSTDGGNLVIQTGRIDLSAKTSASIPSLSVPPQCDKWPSLDADSPSTVQQSLCALDTTSSKLVKSASIKNRDHSSPASFSSPKQTGLESTLFGPPGHTPFHTKPAHHATHGIGTPLVPNYLCIDADMENLNSVMLEIEFESIHRALNSYKPEEVSTGCRNLIQLLERKQKLTVSNILRLQESISSLLKNHDHLLYHNDLMNCVELFITSYGFQTDKWIITVMMHILPLYCSSSRELSCQKLASILQICQNMLDSELYFSSICRYVADTPVESDFEERILLMKYLYSSLPSLDSYDYNQYYSLALSKITLWALDPRVMELKQISEFVLELLYSKNPQVFTRVALTFVPMQQKFLHTFIKSYLLQSPCTYPGVLDRSKFAFHHSSSPNLDMGTTTFPSVPDDKVTIRRRKLNFPGVTQASAVEATTISSSTFTPSATAAAASSDSFASRRFSNCSTKPTSPSNCENTAENNFNVGIQTCLNALTSDQKKINRLEMLDNLKRFLKESTLKESAVSQVLVSLLEFIQSDDSLCGGTGKCSIEILSLLIESYSSTVTSYSQSVFAALIRLIDQDNDDITNAAFSTCNKLCATLSRTAFLTLFKTIAYLKSNNNGTRNGVYKLLENHIKTNKWTSDEQSDLLSLVPFLLEAFLDGNCILRRCGLNCLLAVYAAIGDDSFMPSLENIEPTKKKLLLHYMKRGD